MQETDSLDLNILWKEKCGFIDGNGDKILKNTLFQKCRLPIYIVCV